MDSVPGVSPVGLLVMMKTDSLTVCWLEAE